MQQILAFRIVEPFLFWNFNCQRRSSLLKLSLDHVPSQLSRKLHKALPTLGRQWLGYWAQGIALIF